MELDVFQKMVQHFADVVMVVVPLVELVDSDLLHPLKNTSETIVVFILFQNTASKNTIRVILISKK